MSTPEAPILDFVSFSNQFIKDKLSNLKQAFVRLKITIENVKEGLVKHKHSAEVQEAKKAILQTLSDLMQDFKQYDANLKKLLSYNETLLSTFTEVVQRFQKNVDYLHKTFEYNDKVLSQLSFIQLVLENNDFVGLEQGLEYLRNEKLRIEEEIDTIFEDLESLRALRYYVGAVRKIYS